jgi:uncharacterized protein (DUF2062 family)
MLFRRRTPEGFLDRLRVALWPRNGWSRSLRYFTKRVLRLSGSPHAIALGIASGVFVSWTPFVGLHIVLSVALAFILNANLVAAGLGTIVGNPLTFPFIWWSTFQLGKHLLHTAPDHVHLANIADMLAHKPFSSLIPLLKPMIAGAIPLGVASGAAAYLIVVVAVRAYQSARRKRLDARRREVLIGADQAAE